jgi:hypothetical protein
MKAARCAPALCGVQPNDLAAGTAGHRSNLLAARFNGTENPPNDRESGECRFKHCTYCRHESDRANISDHEAL